MSRKNRDFFREKSEFLRDRLLLLFIDIARRGLLIAYNPVTVIPPNINGMFIHGYHIKLRYVVAFVVVILMWTVAASISSMKYKEESFAHYSMYRAVKEQHQYQHLMEADHSQSKVNKER